MEGSRRRFPPDAVIRISPPGRAPQYTSAWRWVRDAGDRHGVTPLVGALFAWTGLPFAMWAGAIGAVAGVVAGIVGVESVPIAHQLGVDTGVGFFAAIAGAFVGFAEGFVLIYQQLIDPPLRFLGAIIAGVWVGFVLVWLMAYLENPLLLLRGYRRLSRREAERVTPLLRRAGEGMKVPAQALPRMWIADIPKPMAWAHMRSIVITRGLLGDIDDTEKQPQGVLDDGALGAILARELHHWLAGDVVSMRVVWAASWPIIALYNLGGWLSRGGHTPFTGQRTGRFLTFLGWFFLWPTWVVTKLVLAPMMTRDDRLHEYQADTSAAMLGEEYRLGLRRALAELSLWEAPRTAWEDVIAATHPPIELRLERLETPSNQLGPVPANVVDQAPGKPAPRPVRPKLPSS